MAHRRPHFRSIERKTWALPNPNPCPKQEHQTKYESVANHQSVRGAAVTASPLDCECVLRLRETCMRSDRHMVSR